MTANGTRPLVCTMLAGLPITTLELVPLLAMLLTLPTDLQIHSMPVSVTVPLLGASRVPRAPLLGSTPHQMVRLRLPRSLSLRLPPPQQSLLLYQPPRFLRPLVCSLRPRRLAPLSLISSSMELRRDVFATSLPNQAILAPPLQSTSLLFAS